MVVSEIIATFADDKKEINQAVIIITIPKRVDVMKKLLFTLLSIIAVLAANAEPVSRSEALQKARQFMPGKQFNANQASSRSKRVMADKEPFYIFNAEEGGFVVISGDDRTVPVIG